WVCALTRPGTTMQPDTSSRTSAWAAIAGPIAAIRSPSISTSEGSSVRRSASRTSPPASSTPMDGLAYALDMRVRGTILGLALLLAAGAAQAGGGAGKLLFADSFAHANGPNDLVTNAWALWNSGKPQAVVSKRWQMTAGSLFSRDGVGWTGVPDGCGGADARSQACTESAVFRLNTARSDFGDVSLSVRIRLNRL